MFPFQYSSSEEMGIVIECDLRHESKNSILISQVQGGGDSQCVICHATFAGDTPARAQRLKSRGGNFGSGLHIQTASGGQRKPAHNSSF
jgi:hypothetical protein